MILKRLLGFINEGDGRSIKAKKNILFGLGVKGGGLLLSLIRVPIVLSYLNTEKYGIWLTISSIVLWVNYLDLGIGHGLRNNFAISLANNDKLKAKSLVSVAYYYLSLIFLGFGILAVPIIWFLDWAEILNTNIVGSGELRDTVLIVFILFIIRFIGNLITSILRADQRPGLAEMLDPLGSAISLVFIILVSIFFEDSLFWACVAIALPSTLVMLIANVFFFKRDYHDYSPSLKFIRKDYFKDVFNLGMKFFIIQLGALIMFSTSNFILIRLVGPEEVTVFNISRRYYTLPMVFFSMILLPYWSAITEAYVKEDYLWIKNTILGVNKISALFVGGLIIMYFIQDWVIELWLGEPLGIPLSLSIALLIWSTLKMGFSMYTSFLNGTGKIRLSLYVALVKMLLFLPVAYFLTMEFEATGLVWTLILVNALPTSILEFTQYQLIINNKAKRIWNK